MARYALLLREAPVVFANLSPADMQRIVEMYKAWSSKLVKDGKLVSGEKLEDGGGKRLVRKDGALLVTDGPYADAKDVIGGFYLLEASSLDEAIAITRTCPHLEYGEIELRRIDEV